MSEFTEALLVSPLADGNSWVIMDKFEFYLDDINNNHIITVPIGFVTDFASVPRLFWLFIPKWGKYGNAAVIHDWLYWEQKFKNRRQADDILLEGMSILSVNPIQKIAIYYAVRLFGWLAWFRNSAEKNNGFNRLVSTSTIKATKKSSRPTTIKSAYRFIKEKHEK